MALAFYEKYPHYADDAQEVRTILAENFSDQQDRCFINKSKYCFSSKYVHNRIIAERIQKNILVLFFIPPFPNEF